MGHERQFCSGARPLDLWIPPTSSAPESDHYALDGGDMAGGDRKIGRKMLVKKLSMLMLLCLWKTSLYFLVSSNIQNVQNLLPNFICCQKYACQYKPHCK